MLFPYLQNALSPYFWPFAAFCAFTFTHLARKLMIISVANYYFVMSKDNSCKLPAGDPGEMLNNTDKIMKQETKTLILIRHGESVWNEVFNRGINYKFPFRLMYALARELILLVTSDSFLIDSPLGSVGVTQAQHIRQFILKGYARQQETDPKNEYINILRNSKASNSLIVSSPLRRCIETVTLALFDRITESKGNVVLHSSLQEMTRNFDGVSLSYVNERPPLSLTMRGLEDQYNVDWDTWFDERISVETKAGFKSPQRRGDDRLRSFARWVFEQPQDVIIVSGHSLWNKCFFRAYLPRDLQHPAKTCKIANGGVIAVKFSKLKIDPGVTRYAIHTNSITPLVKNFEKKKRQSKLKKWFCKLTNTIN